MKALYSSTGIFSLLMILFISINLSPLQAQEASSQADSTLPEGFPIISIKHFDNPTPGNLFIAPFGSWGMFPNRQEYICIIDNFGHPIYFKEIHHNHINDFKLQANGQLTFAGGTGIKHYIMNEKMEVVDSISPPGYWTDLHEITIDEDEHKFLIGIDTRQVDMSQIVEGGQTNATVMGHVIQELDASNNVIFEWNSWDYYNIIDCQEWVDLTTSVVDYAHVNTIEVDSDTSLLILARNFNEITKIDRRTGEMIWRLGGVNNQFTFINDTLQWAWPHDIRKIGDGLFSMFDNGRFNTPAPHFSSGVVYQIDESAHTITQVKRYRNPTDIYGAVMGNFQLMDNGNFVTGWGAGSYPDSVGITEFKPDGSVAHSVSFDAINYRAWKHKWQPHLFYPENDTVDFGEIIEDTTAFEEITIYNNADYMVAITGAYFRHGVFTCDTEFPLELPANGTAIIKVNFQPGETGLFKDVLSLHADNADQSQRIGRQIFLKAEVPQNFGINNLYLETLTISPNPTRGMTHINLPQINSGQGKITDLLGNTIKILSFENQKAIEIDLSDFIKGIYILSIKTNTNKTYYTKIVRN